ncbi:MAG: pilin [Candidatus Altiarchaeota archaeon]|nr:pilin [Candidatus Altiarchaeota archaeon]
MITVEDAKRLFFIGISLVAFAGCAVAMTAMTSVVTQLQEVNTGLRTVASALGVLVISYAGIRWIMADSPQERDDAKKTIIYVIIGLLVVAASNDLVAALYSPAT